MQFEFLSNHQELIQHLIDLLVILLKLPHQLLLIIGHLPVDVLLVTPHLLLVMLGPRCHLLPRVEHPLVFNVLLVHEFNS